MTKAYNDNAYNRWLYDSNGRLVVVMHVENTAGAAGWDAHMQPWQAPQEVLVPRVLVHESAHKFVSIFVPEREGE